MTTNDITVYDPAMCCETGVCGPEVDPKLARFSADLDWLAGQGVAVRRFNLAQEPGAFAEDASAKSALQTKGEAALPLIKAGDAVVSSGAYPSRDELAAWAGLSSTPSLYTEAGASASEPSAAQEKASGCCGPAKAEASPPKEQASGCCGPSAKSEPAAPKKSGCC